MAILTFHNCNPSIISGANNYFPKRLANLLSYIKNAKFSFVPLSDYLAMPRKNRQVALTFDDGYESFYLHAYPILSELGIPATVFIPAGFIGKTDLWDYTGKIFPKKHLSISQVERLSLSDGITFGSHGLTHSSLTGMSDRLLKIELSKSKDIIENISGKKIHYLSYPFGRYNRMVEVAAMEAGYKKGLSLTFRKKDGRSFSMPRIAIYAFDTPFSVISKLNRGLFYRIEMAKGAIMNAFAGGTVALNRIRGMNK